jgi:hypothetical protein
MFRVDTRAVSSKEFEIFRTAIKSASYPKVRYRPDFPAVETAWRAGLLPTLIKGPGILQALAFLSGFRHWNLVARRR